MSKKIVITVELDNNASESEAKQLAEAMLTDLKYYDPEECEGDLRAHVLCTYFKFEVTDSD